LATNQGLGVCGNLYEAAVFCPVLRATWGVAQSQLEIGDPSAILNPWRVSALYE